MADSQRRYLDSVTDDIEAKVRAMCLALPDAYEEQAWAGVRWLVRKRTFAHVLGVAVEDAEPSIVLAFRASPDDVEMFRHTGHPFFVLGWGRNAIGMILDDDTDWDDVVELMIDSYCVMAPKKLVARVDRPASPNAGAR